MLTIEITNDETHPSLSAGIAEAGHYDYVARVKGRVIASGRVENVEREHFSLLLQAIAEDAKWRAFVNTVGEAAAAQYKSAAATEGRE